MSTPFQPSGIACADTWRACASALISCAATTSVGISDLAGREQLAAVLDLIGLDERVADVRALRDEERERHRAADEELVAAFEQRVDHAELVAHLHAAEHHDERLLRRVEQRAQHLDLACEQPPGGRRHHPRRPDDRRVRAVRGAERVVDVHVAELGEVRRERGIVRSPRPARSAGSRAASPRPGSRLLGCVDRGEVGDARRERHLDAEQLAEPLRRPARASTSGRPCPSAGRGASSATISQSRSSSHVDRRAATR